MPDLYPAMRIEIPAHYDVWMQGARYGTVKKVYVATHGTFGYATVKMDHSLIKRHVKIPTYDWEYVKLI